MLTEGLSLCDLELTRDSFVSSDRFSYISALKQIRVEGTDEHLIAFFFKTAISRMKEEMAEKRKLSKPILFF